MLRIQPTVAKSNLMDVFGHLYKYLKKYKAIRLASSSKNLVLFSEYKSNI